MPCPRFGLVGIAPPIEDHRPDPAPGSRSRLISTGAGPRWRRGDVALIGGGPGNAGAGQQGCRHPDPFAASSASRALGHLGPIRVRDGDHARELPVHGACPVEIPVGACNDSCRTGGPDETLVRVERLAGRKRQPTAGLMRPRIRNRANTASGVPGTIAVLGYRRTGSGRPSSSAMNSGNWSYGRDG